MARADEARFEGIISVLCPTRGRAERAAETADLLFSLADDPRRLEVLFGIDHDDPTVPVPLVERIPDVFTRDGIKRVTFSERHGYRQLHLYYNPLAQLARGDWLLLWNDDVLMETPRWDAIVREHDHRRPVALNITSEQPGAMNLFPFVSRPWYKALGHMSLQAHCDTWIQDVSRAAGVERNETRIRVRHLREDDGDPAVYAITSPEFYSPAFADLRAIDAEKLREAFHA